MAHVNVVIKPLFQSLKKFILDISVLDAGLKRAHLSDWLQHLTTDETDFSAFSFNHYRTIKKT